MCGLLAQQTRRMFLANARIGLYGLTSGSAKPISFKVFSLLATLYREV